MPHVPKPWWIDGVAAVIVGILLSLFMFWLGWSIETLPGMAGPSLIGAGIFLLFGNHPFWDSPQREDE